MVKLTGTLWRAKSPLSSPSTYPVTRRPTAHRYVGVPVVRFVEVGETVLIGSDLIPREDCVWDTEKHQTFVQVLLPVVGYMNSTYFVSNSIWFERVA